MCRAVDNRPEQMAEAKGAKANPLSPAVVLVRPQMGENIGAAARVMANFGLSSLRICAPRDGWPNEKADAMAASGLDVIQAARVTDGFDGAIDDLTLVFAATARPRDMEKPVMTPRQAMDRARAEIAAGGRPGFVFGPEASGLAGEEVAMADAILAIPVDAACPSLNLAQAVAVTAYEWMAGDPAPQDYGELAPAAPRDELEGLILQLEDQLGDAGYFFPEHRADTMKRNLRAALSRAGFTSQEVRSLRGALKSLARDRG